MLEKLGFVQDIENKCLYKQTDIEGTTYNLVYIDNLFVASNLNRINKFFSQLSK